MIIEGLFFLFLIELHVVTPHLLFFLFLIETACCDPSSEPSGQDGSDEELQHMFYAELTLYYPYLSANIRSSLDLCMLFANACTNVQVFSLLTLYDLRAKTTTDCTRKAKLLLLPVQELEDIVAPS